MQIALDYDKTYSADPDFWQAFILLCKRAGHEVRIVTARDERFDRTAGLAEVEQHIAVVYCRGVAKRWYCSHFVPEFQPDIWIDDKPESVFINSETSPEDLAAWRDGRGEGETIPPEEMLREAAKESWDKPEPFVPFDGEQRDGE